MFKVKIRFVLIILKGNTYLEIAELFFTAVNQQIFFLTIFATFT